jgi:RNA polymerase sporulation-specific sigma factor
MNRECSLNATASSSEGDEMEILEVIPDEKGKRSVLIDALDSLNGEDRELITLRYFRNFSQQEVSAILKKNQSKVSRLEHKVILKLRKILLSR